MNKYVRLPPETKAFFCAKCGAVALDPNAICEIQGKGTKAHWCGTTQILSCEQCVNKKNVYRFKCANCSQISVNPELLCKPEKIDLPD